MYFSDPNFNLKLELKTGKCKSRLVPMLVLEQTTNPVVKDAAPSARVAIED